MAPEIAVPIEWLQDQAQKINALNVNSCQAARSVVDGSVGRYMQADEERARNWRVTLKRFLAKRAAAFALPGEGVPYFWMTRRRP
mgnify:CR=1 FL=1